MGKMVSTATLRLELFNRKYCFRLDSIHQAKMLFLRQPSEVICTTFSMNFVSSSILCILHPALSSTISSPSCVSRDVRPSCAPACFIVSATKKKHHRTKAIITWGVRNLDQPTARQTTEQSYTSTSWYYFEQQATSYSATSGQENTVHVEQKR